MMFQERSATRESEVFPHHHFQFMLHQVEQVQREYPAEARRREHLREALRERRSVRSRSVRNLISVLACRWSRRSSAPCWDASVRPAP